MEEGKKKSEEDEEMMLMLSFREFELSVALFIVKGLLRRISHGDRVSPSRMTCRILISIGSGDLIFRLLHLQRASFDFEVVNLFLDGMYEWGEEAYRLGVLMNCFSPSSP